MKFRSAFLSFAILILPSIDAARAWAQTDEASERARLAQLARETAQKVAAAREGGQTRPTVPITTPGPNVELSLEEATARALERNLDIAVERLNPQSQELALARVQGAYRPTLTSTFGQQSRINPPSSTLNGGTIVDNDTTTYNAGVTQNVQWLGGTATVLFNNSRAVSSNTFNNYNPAFNSNFSAAYAQPILRDLFIDTNRLQLKVTAINRDISEIQLQGTITTTQATVRNAYWELVYSIQAAEVARGSLSR